MSESERSRFQVGDRVRDRQTGRDGRVLAVTALAGTGGLLAVTVGYFVGTTLTERREVRLRAGQLGGLPLERIPDPRPTTAGGSPPLLGAQATERAARNEPPGGRPSPFSWEKRLQQEQRKPYVPNHGKAEAAAAADPELQAWVERTRGGAASSATSASSAPVRDVHVPSTDELQLRNVISRLERQKATAAGPQPELKQELARLRRKLTLLEKEARGRTGLVQAPGSPARSPAAKGMPTPPPRTPAAGPLAQLLKTGADPLEQFTPRGRTPAGPAIWASPSSAERLAQRAESLFHGSRKLAETRERLRREAGRLEGVLDYLMSPGRIDAKTGQYGGGWAADHLFGKAPQPGALLRAGRLQELLAQVSVDRKTAERLFGAPRAAAMRTGADFLEAAKEALSDPRIAPSDRNRIFREIYGRHLVQWTNREPLGRLQRRIQNVEAGLDKLHGDLRSLTGLHPEFERFLHTPDTGSMGTPGMGMHTFEDVRTPYEEWFGRNTVAGFEFDVRTQRLRSAGAFRQSLGVARPPSLTQLEIGGDWDRFWDPKNEGRLVQFHGAQYRVSQLTPGRRQLTLTPAQTAPLEAELSPFLGPQKLQQLAAGLLGRETASATAPAEGTVAGILERGTEVLSLRGGFTGRGRELVDIPADQVLGWLFGSPAKGATPADLRRWGMHREEAQLTARGFGARLREAIPFPELEGIGGVETADIYQTAQARFTQFVRERGREFQSVDRLIRAGLQDVRSHLPAALRQLGTPEGWETVRDLAHGTDQAGEDVRHLVDLLPDPASHAAQLVAGDVVREGSRDALLTTADERVIESLVHHENDYLRRLSRELRDLQKRVRAEPELQGLYQARAAEYSVLRGHAVQRYRQAHATGFQFTKHPGERTKAWLGRLEEEVEAHLEQQLAPKVGTRLTGAGSASLVEALSAIAEIAGKPRIPGQLHPLDAGGALESIGNQLVLLGSGQTGIRLAGGKLFRRLHERGGVVWDPRHPGRSRVVGLHPDGTPITDALHLTQKEFMAGWEQGEWAKGSLTQAIAAREQELLAPAVRGGFEQFLANGRPVGLGMPGERVQAYLGRLHDFIDQAPAYVGIDIETSRAALAADRQIHQVGLVQFHRSETGEWVPGQQLELQTPAFLESMAAHEGLAPDVAEGLRQQAIQVRRGLAQGQVDPALHRVPVISREGQVVGEQTLGGFVSTERELIEGAATFMRRAQGPVVGANVGFDLGTLGARSGDAGWEQLLREQSVDLTPAAQLAFPGSRSYSVENLVRQLTGQAERVEAHSAVSDLLDQNVIANALTQRRQDWWPGLTLEGQSLDPGKFLWHQRAGQGFQLAGHLDPDAVASAMRAAGIDASREATLGLALTPVDYLTGQAREGELRFDRAYTPGHLAQKFHTEYEVVDADTLAARMQGRVEDLARKRVRRMTAGENSFKELLLEQRRYQALQEGGDPLGALSALHQRQQGETGELDTWLNRRAASWFERTLPGQDRLERQLGLEGAWWQEFETQHAPFARKLQGWAEGQEGLGNAERLRRAGLVWDDYMRQVQRQAGDWTRLAELPAAAQQVSLHVPQLGKNPFAVRVGSRELVQQDVDRLLERTLQDAMVRDPAGLKKAVAGTQVAASLETILARKQASAVPYLLQGEAAPQLRSFLWEHYLQPAMKVAGFNQRDGQGRPLKVIGHTLDAAVEDLAARGPGFAPAVHAHVAEPLVPRGLDPAAVARVQAGFQDLDQAWRRAGESTELFFREAHGVGGVPVGTPIADALQHALQTGGEVESAFQVTLGRVARGMDGIERRRLQNLLEQTAPSWSAKVFKAVGSTRLPQDLAELGQEAVQVVESAASARAFRPGAANHLGQEVGNMIAHDPLTWQHGAWAALGLAAAAGAAAMAFGFGRAPEEAAAGGETQSSPTQVERRKRTVEQEVQAGHRVRVRAWGEAPHGLDHQELVGSVHRALGQFFGREVQSSVQATDQRQSMDRGYLDRLAARLMQ